ncbi:MAG: hypothetical protein HC879_06215 [Leptolyngbyaceae cyanobacterium SL_5_9]|nr:hypothetical protein [Leptolyngbyaceae cyanobacterium SL_5_9]NJO76029.1 hypothetical protein [Leptolyngbyaceae cyanobacterium RM1_406_9]
MSESIAANSRVPLLTLEDLPPGFIRYSDEMIQSSSSSGAIANCKVAKAQGSAFVLQQDGEMIERVCVTSSPLSSIFGENGTTSPIGEAFLDAMLSSPDALSQLLGQEKPADLEFLELTDIGDSAVGFRGTVEAIGKADIALFRKDETLNTVFIIHPDHPTPLTSLQDIASKLDERV